MKLSLLFNSPIEQHVSKMAQQIDRKVFSFKTSDDKYTLVLESFHKAKKGEIVENKVITIKTKDKKLNMFTGP